MSIVYVKRNGRTYVYRTETKRVPGKKNPVSAKEYIGVLDRETGMVHMKPLPLRTACSLLSDGRFSALGRGNVLIACKTAEMCGMRDALRRVFDDDGDMILAMAICYAVNPMPGIEHTRMHRGLDLEPVLGDVTPTSKSIRTALSRIDYESMRRYAWAIRGESDAPIIVFGLSGINGGLRRTSLMHPVDLDAGNISLVFFSDDRGRLMTARTTIGRSMNAGAWRRMMAAAGTDVRLIRVLDEVSDDPQEIARMLMDGDGMTMRVGMCTDVLRSALNAMDGNGSVIGYHGTEYNIDHGSLGVELNLR